jgi:hypothetical protein
MKSVVCAVAVIAAGLAAPDAADACSCAVPKPACEAAWTTAAIFSGRVLTVHSSQPKKGPFIPRTRVRFAVVEAFKGVSDKEIEVETGGGGGDCGYRFRQGSEYLVYAHAPGQGGALAVSSCSRTGPLESAANDLAYLRAAFNSNAPLGRIAGTLVFEDQPGSDRRGTPVTRVPVVIERDGVRSTDVTDTGGHFAVEGLDAGRYTISVDLPANQYFSLWPNPVELADIRGCAETSGVVSYNGRLQGRVADARGAPVPGLTVEIVAYARSATPSGQPLASTITDLEGRYEMDHIPRGTYVLGINMQHKTSAGGRFPLAYHPGTDQRAGAGRIVLGRGEQKVLPDFVLPATFNPVRVSGIVVNAEGVPVAGASVYLKGPEETDYILGKPFVTDAAGRFTLAAFEGHQYRVFAEWTPADSTRTHSAAPQLLTAVTHMSPVKLTLRARY